MPIISQKILKYAEKNPGFNRTALFNALQGKYSKGYLSQQLTRLVNQHKLVRHGGGKYVAYALPEHAVNIKRLWKHRFKNKNLADDAALKLCQSQTSFLQDLSTRIADIFEYALTEMVNNAIEHSDSRYIDIAINRQEQILSFSVRDFGVGVFHNIMKKKSLSSETAAIQDLLKGKQTTQPQQHSGEGIFFTSKIADIFILTSHEYQLRIDNLINDVFIQENQKNIKGTRVDFQIDLLSKKKLANVFREYQTNSKSYDFDKTVVKIKLYTLNTVYISRSQAKRVIHQLESFRQIILDFDQVSTVGQAFADEIFRVFALKHPSIMIEAVNMAEPVMFMIKRIKSPPNVKITT